MIARLYRFQGHTSLGFVYKRGQVIRGPLFALKYVRNTRRQHFRVAVVVSRKVDKSAVVRNRIRRRIYEIVRMQTPHITEAYDLVFTVFSPQVATVPADDLEQGVLDHLRKAGVLTSAKRQNHDIVKPKDV